MGCMDLTSTENFSGGEIALRSRATVYSRSTIGRHARSVESSLRHACRRGVADDFATFVAERPTYARKHYGDLMTRILLLGLEPETVDFSDAALPPGMNAEKIRAGIEVAVKQFADRGWEFDVGFIRPDETAGPTVERQLRSTNYDCVVIGAGVRLPPRNLALFEVVIDAIRKFAPGAAIAFNTRPDDSADAAARGLALGSGAA